MYGEFNVTREELLRHSFSKSSRLIEVGASYNPIVPKADGWQTTVIDHADQETLREKYAAETPERIEPVDGIWTGQPIDLLIAPQLLGQYDGLIASHVGEHLPDLIGFLKSLDRILKPSGVITLALPDKRLCFDFYRPVTTTGMLLDAYANGHIRHSLGQVFDSHAYFATRNGAGAWIRDLPLDGGEPKLAHTLPQAYTQYLIAQDNAYHDAHGWCFTPTSFQLNILELHACGVIPWHISRIERAGGVEFYVWLERRTIKLSDAEIEAQRVQLLLQIARDDAADTLRQLSPANPPEPVATLIALPAPDKPPLTISAIIPLYNGARFIANALQSVVEQTLLPFEIIVVDDGSTDHSVEIVKDFQARHPTHNVILMHKENGGQSSARNLGARQARGDLIAFLDQDDQWYAKHLEKLLEPFLDPPPGQPLGWVYSNLDEATVDGEIIHHNFLNQLPAGHHPKRNLYQCIDRDMFVLPSAALISRTVFNEVGGYDERLSGYEDDDLFMRIFRAGKHNVFLNIALSKWCIHEGSSSYTPRMRRSRMIYCRKLLEMFPDKPDKHIYFSRDTILPRFYRQAQAELRHALQANEIADIEETLNELRFLLGIAVKGDGINTIMTRKRAKHLKRLFDRKTAHSVMRGFRLRRRLEPYIMRRVPMGILRRVARVIPLYG
jgi:glycosyltransferase involved in cell wall biosynthesis